MKKLTPEEIPDLDLFDTQDPAVADAIKSMQQPQPELSGQKADTNIAFRERRELPNGGVVEDTIFQKPQIPANSDPGKPSGSVNMDDVWRKVRAQTPNVTINTTAPNGGVAKQPQAQTAGDRLQAIQPLASRGGPLSAPQRQLTRDPKQLTPVTPLELSGSKLKVAVPSKNVMILRPILREVDALVHHATLALFDRESMTYDAVAGDSMVYHSRNILADRFMKSDKEWALWWDDDVIPPIGNEGWSRTQVPKFDKSFPSEFLNIDPIRRLQSHGKTIVGGLYFGRKYPYTAICERTTLTKNDFKKVPRAELKPVGWVGTGFLLVHRSVFESIQKKFPELSPKEGAVNPYEAVWQYFAPNGHAGEDVAFGARALAAGHQSFVDLSVVCGHVGSYVYGPWDQINAV